MNTKPTINPGSCVGRMGLHSIRAAEDCLFWIYSSNDKAEGVGSAIDAIWPFFWEPVDVTGQ